jgi:hypothetical protein
VASVVPRAARGPPGARLHLCSGWWIEPGQQQSSGCSRVRIATELQPFERPPPLRGCPPPLSPVNLPDLGGLPPPIPLGLGDHPGVLPVSSGRLPGTLRPGSGSGMVVSRCASTAPPPGPRKTRGIERAHPGPPTPRGRPKLWLFIWFWCSPGERSKFEGETYCNLEM